MTDTLPTELPGGDATKGRFEWFHNACGTIYADTEDDAIACAYHRILPHDPGNAATQAMNIERVGYNAAHGSDWVAPVQRPATPTANPVLLDIAVPGAANENRAPAVDITPTPQDPNVREQYAPPAPFVPPNPNPSAPGGTLPVNPNTPDFGEQA